jgi:hypothetical protein
MQDTGVETNQEVRDAGEDDGQDSEHGHLSQGLAQEVHVDAIHAVVMFPQEYWHLAAEHLCKEFDLSLIYFDVSNRR